MSMLESVRLEAHDPNAPRTPPPRPAMNAAPVANEAMAAPAPKKKKGPHDCPNCDATDTLKTATFCGKCGFYPKLNRCIEIDKEEEVEEITSYGQMAAKVPIWAWIMISGLAVIVIGSGLIRVLLEGDLETRSSFATTAIFIGLVSFGICHVRAFYIGLRKSEKFNLGTLFAHPVQNWEPAAAQLPQTRRLFYGMSWGLTAAFLALMVIGLDWNSLFKPSGQTGRSFNPMRWVMKAAVFIVKNSQGSEGQPSMLPSSGGSMMADMMEVAGELSEGQPMDVGGEPASFEDALQGFAGKALDQSLGGTDAVMEGSEGVMENLHEKAIADQRQQEEREERMAAQQAMLEANGNATNEQTDEETESGPGKDPKGKDPKEDDKQSSNTGKSSSSTLSPQSSGSPTLAGSPGGVTLGAGTPATPQKPKSPTDGRPLRGSYLIIGYTLSVTGNLHSVVLAEMTGENRARYVDSVPVSEMSSEKVAELKADLDDNRSSKAALRVPFRARWVKPVFHCSVAYKDQDSRGGLEDAAVLSYHRK